MKVMNTVYTQNKFKSCFFSFYPFYSEVMALVDLRLLLTCQLYCSMEGLGSNDDTIIRIICLRCEVRYDEIDA